MKKTLMRISGIILSLALMLGLFCITDTDTYAVHRDERDEMVGEWHLYQIIDESDNNHVYNLGDTITTHNSTYTLAKDGFKATISDKSDSYRSYVEGELGFTPYQFSFGAPLDFDNRIGTYHGGTAARMEFSLEEEKLTIRYNHFAAGEKDCLIIVLIQKDPEEPDPEEPGPKEPESNWYITPLGNTLDAYIESGRTDTIYWEKGTGLPNDVMKKLFENPECSIDFKFTYEGVEHEVYIAPGQAVNDDIKWYGPLWLLEKYGEKGAGGEYTVVKDDNLKDLAAKFGTTVEDLLKKNPFIADKNLIYPGQVIKY